MKFSIVMPCYNGANFIERAIRSVLQQSYSDFELIIVDDGSVDNSIAIIEQLASDDCRISLIKTQNSGKPSVVRNIGIRAAVGDILTFLDADDLYHPDRLKEVAECFRFKDVFDVVFHDVSLIDKNDYIYMSSQVHSKIQAYSEKNNYNWECLFDSIGGEIFQAKDGLYLFFLIGFPLIHTSSVCIRKDRFVPDKLLFPVNLTCAEDLVFWCFLAARGCCGYIDKALSYYRDTPGSITKKKGKLYYDTFVYYNMIISDPPREIDEETKKTLQKKSLEALLAAAYSYDVEGQKLKALTYYWLAMKQQPNLTVLYRAIKVPLRFIINFLAR